MPEPRRENFSGKLTNRSKLVNTDGVNTVFFHIRKVNDALPEKENHDEIITHSGFTLAYNETHEQADWVAYILTRAQVQNRKATRDDNFRADPQVETGSATPSDYKKSGYDRGHLAPAADMWWSNKTMDESFYMSNMSPQVPSFNRGVWKELEEAVRFWAEANDSLYVISGPVFRGDEKTIGRNQVTVPSYYYKIVADITWPDFNCVAFLLPNRATKMPFESFIVSIDSVEQLTGIDFFPAFESTELIHLEAVDNNSFWIKTIASNSKN